MHLSDLTQVMGLCLLLVVAGARAHLTQSPSEPSNELEYYLASRLVSSPLEAALQVGPADGDQIREPRDFSTIPDDSGLEYLINELTMGTQQPNGAADFQKLVETIEELARQEEQVLLLNNELNKHLPSSDPYSTEGPINNPMEFEAALSQLTNALNHGIPNTSNRSALLDNLLSTVLGSMAKELQPQQLGNDLDDTTAYNLTGLLNQKSDDESDDNKQVHSSKQHSGSEYIDNPLALIGHQYMQGGAGEGRQLLGPDGSFENVQVIKSDNAVPSYCDPPNPCPVGYTADDGCLEKFVNSASFSREYQVKQKCSCDNEHSLFNCGSPTAKTIKDYAAKALNDQDTDNDKEQFKSGGGDGDNKLDTLARAIQNRYGNLASIRKLINENKQNY